MVLEQAPRLGGRATSFTDRESGERVDNGQHALFGCYRETYAFLRTIGAASNAPLQSRFALTMADAQGRQATLRCPNLPPPWHLIAGLLRWRAIGLADRASAIRLASVLLRIRRLGARAVAESVPSDLTVDAWLRAHGQSPVLCDWLWRPLAIAALNQRPDSAAAAPFVRVLGELFAPDPDAAAIGLPAVPLDELFGTPAVAFIEQRGGRVLLKSQATVIVDANGRIAGARIGEHVIHSDVVISSVPWHAMDRIWDGAPPPAIAPIVTNAIATPSSPIVTVNLWLDRPLADAGRTPFVGLVDGPMHWVFHKSAIFSAPAAHVAVVASGADDLLRQDNDALESIAFEQLTRALSAPELRLVRSVVVREPRATFSLAPGTPPRPPASTPVPGFFLAGDWTDTGLPGTIEGAVLSGHTAADRALQLATNN